MSVVDRIETDNILKTIIDLNFPQNYLLKMFFTL